METHPTAAGRPFPTLYWLTCRRAVREVGRLEGHGGVAEVNRRIEEDPEFAAALERAHAEYAARRDAHEPLSGGGGVGGEPLGRVKCLHAHLAHHLVCRCNPVGELVEDRIGDVLRPPPCVDPP